MTRISPVIDETKLASRSAASLRRCVNQIMGLNVTHHTRHSSAFGTEAPVRAPGLGGADARRGNARPGLATIGKPEARIVSNIAGFIGGDGIATSGNRTSFGRTRNDV